MDRGIYRFREKFRESYVSLLFSCIIGMVLILVF